MYKEKIEEAKHLIEQAKAILTSQDAGAEEKAKVPEMIKRAKELQAEALQLKEIQSLGLEKMLQEVKEEKEANEATRERKFKSWGEFLKACWLANHKDGSIRRLDSRLQWFAESEPKSIESKDMVESVGASGGFLVPTEFDAQLRAVMGEQSIVRPRATIIRIARRQVNIPVLDQTGTTAGVPHWFGGLTFYWAEEGAEKTASDAEFREVSLVAHKLIGYTRASDELLADAAISLSDFLSGPLGFAGGVAWMEDYAFLQGTGAGQPLGVINAGATITVARQSAATPVQYQDLVNMLEAFLPTGRGVWIISQSAMSNLLTMSGPTGNPSYLWGNATEGRPNTLLGFPVVWTEKTPTVGTAGDVILAGFTYYLIGDRQATTIESTQYDYWRYDKTSWRVVHRVDGQPWLSAPLTLQDGSTQVSPFVILGAKST